MSDKEKRILKLHQRGLKPSQIARKIGYGGNAVTAGIRRVEETLEKLEN